MAREPANLNRFADGLLEVFRRHAADTPELWATPPVSFVRDLGPEAAELPGPVLAVSLNGQGSALDSRYLGAQASTYTLTVAAYIRQPVGYDTAAGDMLADLWRVIVGNPQLKLPPATAAQTAGIDDPDEPTLVSGFMRLGDSRIDASQGEAVVTQEVVIQWVWSGDQP